MSQGKTPATEVQKKTEPARHSEQEFARQPEQGPVQQVAPQAAYRRAQVSRNALTPADLLALQRTVGNRQVQWMVARRVDSANSPQQSTLAEENSGSKVQTKLIVGMPDYISKREDDYITPLSTPTRRGLGTNELRHVVQEASAIQIQRNGGPSAGESDPIQQAISTASTRFPQLARPLSQITLHATVRSARTDVVIMDVGTFAYPSQVQQAQAGFYVFQWDRDGNFSHQTVVDLSTGTVPSQAPLVAQSAGESELRRLRSNRIGIVWITQTVTSPPQRRAPRPDELELPLPPQFEIEASGFRRLRQDIDDRPLTLPGLTGGVFNPEQVYGRPLNFIYYTQEGSHLLVSRQLVGRDFYYLVPITYVQNYLRTYPFEYAGLASAHWIPIARILFDVGVSFIPIIGPLYALVQAGMAVHHAYHNWDRMSGWEKGLVGLTVLLSVVPVIRAGRNIVRGAAAYREGVQSLVNAGLPHPDARRLMLAAGIFQSERATLRIVDTLGDALRDGGRLTATQLQQVQRVFQLMLQRLPTAERAAIAASFATQDIRMAQQFFEGIELTERHLQGLRRLTPEILVILQKAARSEPILVERVALWAARSEEIAAGINKLEGVVRPAHLPYIFSQCGEDLLAQLGRGSIEISPELAAFAKAGRNASQAFIRLMQGTTRAGRNIPGLARILSQTRPEQLSEALAAIQQEFGRLFLTASQLGGLQRLTAETRAILQSAAESDLRHIATLAAESSDAAHAIDQLTAQLGSVLTRRGDLASVLSRVGRGLLERAGAGSGITLSTDLVSRIGRQRSAHQAVNILLRGFQRAGAHVPGLLEEIASRLPTVTAAERTLQAIESAGLRGELFARWALTNSSALRAISQELADGISTISRLHGAEAQAKISGIYRAFSNSHEAAIAVFESLGRIERVHGSNINLQRLIGQLASGAEQTMGASLTLNYVTLRNVRGITAFEYNVSAGSRSRVYDLFAGGTYYEFKYWLGFGGRPAAQAADEFARDLLIHVNSNFVNLRWVISRDAVGSLPAIESMMRGTVSRPEVQAALRAQGISTTEAVARLERAFSQGLVEFF